MHLISVEALPHFENMIYLPMLLIIVEKDRDSFEKGPFKLKGPYVKLVDEATRATRAELRETTIYLRRQIMKVIRCFH
ncbi:hypothetical protein [Sporosarcina sp. resist]|uniref:hypothetical protein n=1 Tax=Sporosarcina sp. resist TaxID=2762563 RepID=UPI00210445CC|nr:hypothetical protein [Sporosarcina sp. resist]